MPDTYTPKPRVTPQEEIDEAMHLYVINNGVGYGKEVETFNNPRGPITGPKK